MDLRNAQARVKHEAYESQPRSVSKEIELTPVQRFDLLQQRFEHIIESRSASVDGISVELPGVPGEPTVWLRLGIYVEKLSEAALDRDIYLSAR